MDFFLSLLVKGLILGAIYGLVALGFVIIYKATSVINFAVGELLMFAAFLAVAMTAIYGLPLAAGIGITLALMVLFGFVLERGVLRPMIGRPVVGMIMATLGLGIFLRGFVSITWGVQTRSLDLLLPTKPLQLGSISVGAVDLAGVGIALFLAAAFAYLFQRSRVGIALRAVADDQQAAMAMGIRVSTVFAVSWALAGLTAVAGGLIWGAKIGVDQYLALLGLKVFPAAILGGLDSLAGAVIGGLVVGVTENLAAGYLDPHVGGGLKDFVPFVLMLVVLMVRPYGLFGREIIERV
ncbi:MAG: branched-chain amino acid ABC transporter permease [Dehalococcoidia bacterium]|jgi:branched-chain amino acid transport system permease protein|nr:branched-chain amino acid ABC transporter permease [Dehalococcoidia bacterium]